MTTCANATCAKRFRKTNPRKRFCNKCGKLHRKELHRQAGEAGRIWYTGYKATWKSHMTLSRSQQYRRLKAKKTI